VSEPFQSLADALRDRYRVERELGAGGMATVYLAGDLKHHRQVAIKALRPELSAALGPERFLREIAIAAQLNHPHILTLIDSGDADGTLYYVMPYVDGETLRARLTRDGALPVPEAARILRDVADALAYAHGHGVVHRDVKPDNIMLTGQQTLVHALVMDFGVARAVAVAGEGTLTTAGLAVGTPAYMAPEQAAADPHVDARADLYAFGVIAYEMLTGRPPFTGATAQQLLAAQVTEPPDPITKHRASVPPALAALVMQCLAKHPADRPQSAAALLPVLESTAMVSGGSMDIAAPPAMSRSLPRRIPRPTRLALVAASVLVALGTAYGYWRHARTAGLAPVPDEGSAPTAGKSIAVLPFDNLSADAGNAYFAAGVQDEILTRLAGIHDLKVIARTSAVQYASHPQDLTQVAQQLGVATVLEGSVQKAGDEVRVNVQLVDARSAAHLWGRSYDRQVKNIFAVETDVATRVADALQAQLLPAEATRLTQLPTTNPTAYDLFLRAEYARHQVEEFTAPDMGAASTQGITLYEQAIAHDSTFALAYAQLAYLEAFDHWFSLSPRSLDRIGDARREVARALALQPDLPEAHLALGYVQYWGARDYPAALKEFELARRSLPNDARVESAIAFVERRQGDFADALTALERAAVLDPRSSSMQDEVASTLSQLRRYTAADAAFDRALAIEPGSRRARLQKAWNLVLAGAPQRAQRLLRSEAPSADAFSGAVTQFDIARALRQPDSELAVLAHAPALVNAVMYFGKVPVTLFRGEAWETKGDTLQARQAYEDARRVLEERVKTVPSDRAGWSALGVAYACLGRRADAIRAGQRATDLLPISRDAMYGPEYVARLAEIYARVGEPDSAIVLLRHLLAIPAGNEISVPLLRLDPAWDPLRADPRFRALLQEFSSPASAGGSSG